MSALDLAPEAAAWIAARATPGWKPRRRPTPKVTLPRIGAAEKARLYLEHDVMESVDRRQTRGSKELELEDFMYLLSDPKWKPRKTPIKTGYSRPFTRKPIPAGWVK